MTDNQIKEILQNSKTIAMIGVSSEKKGEDPKNLKRKPANVVMKYMLEFGYKVIPVNPFAKGEVINGETVIESLDKISEKIDIVDIFRPSKETPGIAKQAVKIGKQAFYKQLEMPLRKAYAYTSKMMTLNMKAQDAQEGISAFLEKRKPKWKNK